MSTRFALIMIACALPLTACGGAGSSGDADGGGNKTGSGGTGGTTDIDPGLGGSGSTGTSKGGSRPITPEELEKYRSGACAGWSAEPEPKPAILQFIVDVSNSMNDKAPGSRDSKWEVTRLALSEAFESLPASTGVGATFYPAMVMDDANWKAPIPVSNCIDSNWDVNMALLGASGSPQRKALANSMVSVNVDGGTPTHDAYLLAGASLARSTLDGDRFLVLVTDGQPTYSQGCYGSGMAKDAVDPSPIVAAVAAQKAKGVRTFVIGAPGSEKSSETGQDTRPWLSEASSTGGTAKPGCSDTGPNYCHFDMSVEPSFDEGLRKALASILGQVVSCDYALPVPPDGKELDPNAINVVFTAGNGDMSVLFKDENPKCTEGWHLSADGKGIELCSASCNKVKQDAKAELELLFGCASETGPIQ